MAIKDFVVNGGITANGTLSLVKGTSVMAPLKFTAGSVLSTPLAGTVEFDGTKFFITNSANVRKTVAYTDSDITGVSSNVTGIVAVVNGGTGADNAAQARTNLGAAPLLSPNFQGVPTAPTPAASDTSTTIATTAFVKNAMGAVQGGAVASADRWTTPRTLSFTGDASAVIPGIDGTQNGGAIITLATVNTNPDTFGNATSFPIVTVNGKGLVTNVTTQTLTTTNVAEGTNLYFTNGRASAAAPVQTVFGRQGNVVLQSGDVTGALGYTPIDSTKMAAANGVATLDSTGRLNTSQIPAIAISDTFIVASDTAMTALTAQTGDVAVRTDLRKSFILKGTDASLLANWQELLTPTDVVQSVNGKVGVVTLSTTDITEGSNQYFTTARAQGSISVVGSGLTYSAGVITSNATTNNTASTLVLRDASGNFTAGTITAALVGNAASATKLATARAINGVSFDGTNNITIADSTKLALDGSNTMTGMLNLVSGKFLESTGTAALDANNSDIVGINGIYFEDIADGIGEGINFYRDATHWDTLYMTNGVLYIQRNRTNNAAGTNDTVWHSANLTKVSQLANDAGYLTSASSAPNVSGVVAIANGGTAATTAADALVNLGAVATDGSSKMTGKLLVEKNNVAINAGSYTTGNIEIRTNDASNPVLGFHRSGSTAVALYHDSNSSLRLRDANTNGDFLMYHSGNLTNLNQLTNGPGYAVSASPTFSGNVKRSVANNITAVGSTQATAAVLTNTDIAVVQFGPGAGVALPASAVGAEVVIINNSGGAINVYPPSGATIDWLAANAAYSLGDKSKLTFVCTSASQWFSLTAVFA